MDRARGRLGDVRAGVRAWHDVEAQRHAILEDVTQAYRNAGYPRARAGGFEVRLAEDRGRIHVGVRVDAGPRLRFSRVRVSELGGPAPIADGLWEGEWYSETRVNEAVDRLERTYRERGYAAVVVSPRLEVEDGAVALEITVEPGPRFVIARVVISVGGTVEEVVPAEVGLRLGAPARRSDLAEAQARLREAYGREVVFRLEPGDPPERATARFSVQ